MNKITQTTIEISGISFLVPFPNVRQVMRIEAMKMTFSNGLYPQMVNTGVKSMEYNLDLIDAISYFMVLIPEFAKKLNVDDISNLSIEDVRPIIIAYKKEFLPWFQPLMEAAQKLPDISE